MDALADAMGTPASVAYDVALLQGPAFCATTPDPAQCQGVMGGPFSSVALPVLARYVGCQAFESCDSVFPSTGC